MSLVNDPGYLVHSLRLSYLRNVDDPYGGRIISWSPSYTSNPYILAASLADVHRWPELEYPSSPPISDDEGDSDKNVRGPSGLGGAIGLKHHQTIMGSRSGALGMRVTGRRGSTSKRASQIANRHTSHHEEPESTPQAALSRTNAIGQEVDVVVAASAAKSLPKEDPPPPEPPAKEIQFIPKFKGAAEMEARRKLRMQARQGQPISAPRLPSITSKHLNPEISSEEEDEGLLEDENVDDSDLDECGDDMDEGDEFDPDFAATRTPGISSDSASDIGSILSGTASVTSISNPSAFGSFSYVGQHTRIRSRLSPVSEGRGLDESHDGQSADEHRKAIDDRFEMIKLLQPSNHRPVLAAPRQEARKRGVSISQSILVAPTSDIAFTRLQVTPVRPQVSALSAMLASTGGSANPFSELYGSISGRGESASMDVKVFFPHARQPKGKVMLLNVRRDATVEEVIGFTLWSYWEEGWLPKLNEGVREDDPKLSGIGWIMRIAEDDGEVDEDFPPPDRTGKISKFNFDAFAILAASPVQRKSMCLLHPVWFPQSVPGPGTSALFGTTPILSSSLGPSSSHGPPIFLRIRVADTADAVHISTTIPVSAGMYMQEALELVCRKRKLANPKDYALILNDLNMLVYLDRTVASLEGKRELTLVKRSMLPQLGIEPETRAMRTTDPNGSYNIPHHPCIVLTICIPASIFKRISDVPDMQYNAATDYTTAYKRYTVYRKMPMLARQERTLAIDGVYIHIMPSAHKAKAVFDSGKTALISYKEYCGMPTVAKTSTLFKVVVQRDSRNKRYDFEADTPKLAAEIVQAIKSLKATLDRSSTVHRSRRSRHVG
ncbi:stress-activated map kinase interacting protein 1-domain-containing protein [Melanogaster broomeanus]|nr:stress-activated map kinase interacting protein 1-domain-containing protein [Melanogaster broomeanus]